MVRRREAGGGRGRGAMGSRGCCAREMGIEEISGIEGDGSRARGVAERDTSSSGGARERSRGRGSLGLGLGPVRVGPDRLEWGGPSGLADGLRGKWPAWLPLLTPLLTLFKTENKEKDKGKKRKVRERVWARG